MVEHAGSPRDAQRGDGARRCAAAAFASGGASAPGLGWTGPLNRKGVCAAAAEEESPPPPLSTDKGGLPKQPGWKQWLQVSYSQALVLPPRSGMHPRSTQHAYTRCAHRSLWSRGLASLWRLRCRGVIRWSCGADNHYFKPTSTSSASAASTTTCRCSPFPFPPLVLPTPCDLGGLYCTYGLGILYIRSRRLMCI